MRGGRVATAVVDLAIALATIAGIWLVARHAVEFGSRRGNWVFPYLREVDARLLAVACVAAIAVVMLHEIARRAVDTRPAIVVGAAYVVGVIVQTALRSLAPHSMSSILLSGVSDSFYVAAGRVRPWALLSDFEHIAPTLPLHARVNMPGKILIHHALRAITSSPDMVAILVVMLSTAVGLVLYAVVARIFTSRSLGLDAMTLWMIVPTTIAHHPALNVVAPLPAILAVWALVRYLAVPSPWSALAVGASIYVTVFFDPLALWLGAAFAPLIPNALVRRRMRVRDVPMLAVLSAATCLGIHGAVVSATGFDVWKRLLEMRTIGVAFNVAWKRPYDIWLVTNPKDVALAVGPAVMIVFVSACGLAVWRLARVLVSRGRRAAGDPGPSLTLATLAVLSTLVVLNVNRGEVARLWIPVFVPIQVAVAWCLAASHATSRVLLLAGTVAYGVVTIATVGYAVP